MSTDFSSQPPFEPFPPDAPRPKSNNTVIWIVLGAVVGTFALCGFCVIGSLVAISTVGQSANKTFVNVGSAIQAAGNPANSAAEDVAERCLDWLSDGNTPFNELSSRHQNGKFLRVSLALQKGIVIPPETKGHWEVTPGNAPPGKQAFTGVVDGPKGEVYRVNLVLIQELGGWKVDEISLEQAAAR